MTKETTVEHAEISLPFPGRHVMAVFDSWQQGEQAVQALLDAGFHVQDITLIAGQDFPSALQEHVRKEGPLRHLMHQLQLSSDEGSLSELFLAAARDGSSIISIYVPQSEKRDEVSALLFAHGARLVKYVGYWTIEDLFPSSKEGSLDAEASKGLGDKPESDEQHPEQALQSSTSTGAQDGRGEQVLRSTAAEVAQLFVRAARSAHGDAEKQSQLCAVLERSRVDLSKFIHASSQHSQQTNSAQNEDDEQEGQEMNIEQAHETNSAQYTGKPGIKAPSFGQETGSAYSYNMDL